MSVYNIKEEDLMNYGVKSLPTRPSTPSLYSGRTLSAEELKEAFDRLPTLIAQRFNDLLYATGLFDEEDPKDRFAELIATEIYPDHSLADFFADVKSGALALYLAADDTHAPLSEVVRELREAILSLEARAISVEGEGDLLSDVRMEGAHVILMREGSTQAILEQAKAYADAPQGEVAEDSSLPVSGKEVFAAVRSVADHCDTLALSRRVEVLEKTAEGALYTFPTVDSETAYFRADRNALPNAALCRLGGACQKSSNLLPEKVLTTMKSDKLSITWDNEASCLILNGSISKEDGTVPIAVLNVPAAFGSDDNTFFGVGLFAHSGRMTRTGTTGTVSFTVSGDNGKSFAVTLPAPGEEQNIMKKLRGIPNVLSGISISATAPFVFEDYRFNLHLEEYRGRDTVYAPFIERVLPVPIPASLSVYGANDWKGEYEKRSEEKAVFVPEDTYEGKYIHVSLVVDSDYPFSDSCCFEVVSSEGTQKHSLPKGERSVVTLYDSAPLTEFRVWAADTQAASAGYTVVVKDFQIEQTDGDDPAPFSLPLTHTLPFPAAFARYADSFWSLDGEKCNHFDFERGVFSRIIHRITIDGSLTFTNDASVPGRFSAPFVPPAALLTGSYRPFCLFNPLTDPDAPDECLWFTEDCVVIQSALFESAEELSAFFSLFPLDVLYEGDRVDEFLLPEESDFWEPPTLPVTPFAFLYLSDAEGELTPAFVRMQYQTKIQTEETV